MGFRLDIPGQPVEPLEATFDRADGIIMNDILERNLDLGRILLEVSELLDQRGLCIRHPLQPLTRRKKAERLDFRAERILEQHVVRTDFLNPMSNGLDPGSGALEAFASPCIAFDPLRSNEAEFAKAPDQRIDLALARPEIADGRFGVDFRDLIGRGGADADEERQEGPFIVGQGDCLAGQRECPMKVAGGTISTSEPSGKRSRIKSRQSTLGRSCESHYDFFGQSAWEES